MASAEIENEHFRQVVQHTPAAGDTVGKFAARANDYTSRSLNSGMSLMTSRTNPHSGSTFRWRRRTS
jgi:hypothetical protein